MIRIDVAHFVAEMAFMRVLPFAAPRVIARLGKSGPHRGIGQDGVPAAVVEVEVRVDDDIHAFRIDRVAADYFRHRGRNGGEFHALARLLARLIACAGFHQDSVAASLDDVAVEGQPDAVFLIRLELFAPKSAGDDAEHCAAVPPVEARLHQGDFEIAQFQA